MNKKTIHQSTPRENFAVFIFLSILVVTSTVLSIFWSSYIPDNPCFIEKTIATPVGQHSYYENCDSPDFLRSGAQFPDYYRENSIRMSRPGYPLLLNMAVHIGINGLAGAIIVNIIFAILTAFILYLLVRYYLGKTVAIWSSVLLIFSTHFHLFLGQAHTETIGDFVIVLSLYLIHRYCMRQTTQHVVVYSLLYGLLLLIKFQFLIHIFLFLLAIRYRQYSRYLLFFIISLIPTGLWYLYVTKIMHIPFVSAETTMYHQVTWLFSNILHIDRWFDIVRVFIYSTGLFVIDSFLVYLILPIPLAIYGLYSLRQFPNRYYIFVAYVCSVALMLFLILWGGARLAYATFPLILPLATYGFIHLMQKLRVPRYTKWFIAACIAATLILTNTANIYRLIPQYDYNNVRCVSDAGVLLEGKCSPF